MEKPRPLEELLHSVAGHPEIIAAMEQGGHATIAELLASGELPDLMRNNENFGTSIPARGAEGDLIDIEILNYGGLHWIRVNEFDDIGYFTSEEAAEAHAGMEYEDLIDAYDNYEEYEEDSEEENELAEDEEDDGGQPSDRT